MPPLILMLSNLQKKRCNKYLFIFTIICQLFTFSLVCFMSFHAYILFISRPFENKLQAQWLSPNLSTKNKDILLCKLNLKNMFLEKYNHSILLSNILSIFSFPKCPQCIYTCLFKFASPTLNSHISFDYYDSHSLSLF